MTCAILRFTGAITMGSSRTLMRNVPNRFPAIGWRNSDRTLSGAQITLTLYAPSNTRKTTMAMTAMVSDTQRGISKTLLACFQATLNPVRPMFEPKKPIGRYSSVFGVVIDSTVVAMRCLPYQPLAHAV
jgi:hypothetical protein